MGDLNMVGPTKLVQDKLKVHVEYKYYRWTFTRNSSNSTTLTQPTATSNPGYLSASYLLSKARGFIVYMLLNRYSTSVAELIHSYKV